MSLKVEWDNSKKAGTVTLSNNNLTALLSTVNGIILSNIGKTEGKYYWEITYDSYTSTNAFSVGVASEASKTSLKSRYFYSNNGAIYPQNEPYSTAYYPVSTIGVFLNVDDGKIRFYKDGVNLGEREILITGKPLYACVMFGSRSGNATGTANFGASDFKYLPNDLPNNTRAYDESIIFNPILLKSNNKTYSLESIDTVYETKMTSNTAPSPFVASASSEANGGQAFKAFSGSNSTTNFWATVEGVTSAWLQINYGQSKKINKVTLTARASNANTQSPKDFEILGSNDGVNFILVKTIKNQTSWLDSESRIFSFDTCNYRIYRINILNNNGANQTFLKGVTYGYEDLIILDIPLLNMKNFTSYGMNSPVQVDGISSSKNYILQDTVSEDVDRLWKVQLNRKPLSIGFN